MRLCWYIIILIGFCNLNTALATATSTSSNSQSATHIALNSKRSAATALRRLAKSTSNGEQAFRYLHRAAQLESEIASLQLRLSNEVGKTGTLNNFHKASQSVVHDSTYLIEKFPSHRDIYRVFLLRGQALKDLGDKPLAIRDLLKVAFEAPDHSDIVTSALLAYDLLAANKDYKTAIRCLNRANIQPIEKSYPLAVEYLAWSHFYLKEHEKAIDHMKTLLRIEKENAFKAVGFFMATAIEEKTHFDSQRALHLLETILSPDEVQKALVPFANSLAAKDLSSALDELIAAIERESYPPRLVVDLRLLALDPFLNSGRVEGLGRKLGQLFAAFKKLENPQLGDPTLKESIKRQLSRCSNRLVAQQDQNYPILRSVYELLLETVDGKGKDAPLYHSNFAEISFRAKDFDTATQHYQWLFEHTGQPNFLLRAVSARYEAFKLKGWVPEKMVATNSAPTQSLPPLEPELKQWGQWLKTLSLPRKESELVLPFRFEWDRILYHRGYHELALKGFRELAKKKDLAIAEKAASAVIDIQLALSNWDSLYSEIMNFRRRSLLKNTPVGARLDKVGIAAALQISKLAYENKKCSQVLSHTQDVLKLFPPSENRAELLVLAGNCHVSEQEWEKATAAFDSALQQTSNKILRLKIGFLQAALEEKRYRLDAAAARYCDLARQGKIEGWTLPQNLALNCLFFAWSSSQHQLLASSLADKQVCPKNNTELCDRYNALSQVSSAKILDESE
ncbi:MAG: hypothetical protein HY537_05110, partial [Deltaproteobacteria bacterium]|nr:hypothetical protein [Deltaproteobacteria bacterium]